MINKYFLHFGAIIALLVATAVETEATPINKSKSTTTSETSYKVDMEDNINNDDRLFDNTSMERVLNKAELLCIQSDMVAAKKQWTRVIEFMHKPRWFPTAAMVPVSLRFAKLADLCIKRDQIEDAHELMHASFEFPFHLKNEEEEIDAIAGRLVAYDRRTEKLDKCKTFLHYAIEKSAEPRRSTYQKWLQSLEQESSK
jgi:hypothetical protein